MTIEGLEFSEKLCPYVPRACFWVGTYRCTEECEYHPMSFMDPEVLKKFEQEPWRVFCLTCGQFLETRFGHPEGHVVATGLNEYREKLPQFVLERMKGTSEEVGDIQW